jgi:uncharacterized protein
LAEPLNFGIIKKKLLTVGERDTFLQIEKIIGLAIKANTVTARMVNKCHSSDSLLEESQQIRLLEKEGDETSFKIREDIVEGAISPNILDNLLECVELADTVLDNHYYISRELNRMKTATSDASLSPQLLEFDSVFAKMLGIAGEAMVVLQKLLTESNIDRIVELRRQIESLEEQGDDVKDGGFDKLYNLAQRINYLQFVHYSELLHKLDDILDGCEDISDLILSIVASISK